MIVPMKKVILLFHDVKKDKIIKTVEDLRYFGGFHFGLPVLSNTACEAMQEALEILKAQPEKSFVDDFSSEKEAVEIAREIVGQNQEQTKILAQIEKLDKVSQWYKEWSPVSLSSIKQISQAGYEINLYEISVEEYAVLDSEQKKNTFVFAEEKDVVRLVSINSSSLSPSIKTGQIEFPAMEFDQVAIEKELLEKKAAQVLDKLKKMTACAVFLKEGLAQEQSQIEFEQVVDSLETTAEIEGLYYVTGYIPKDRVKAFEEVAAKNSWGYTIADPEIEDQPPTLLKNPVWTEPVYMLYKFLGLRIGYREMDVSNVFILFYTIIAGLLVADAGYGLVFLLLILFANIKAKSVDKRYFHLGYLLSGSIIVCGALTGAWFGSETIVGLPGLRDLVIPQLAAFDMEKGGMSDNIKNMMELGFGIGIIHLGLAHLMRGWKQRKTLEILGHVGWISFLLAVYSMVRFLIFKAPLPEYFSVMMISGIILMFVFSKASLGIVEGMKSIMATFIFDVIGGFSDMISYIRIPIVGLVTVVLGSLFNLMVEGSIIALPITMFCHVFGMVLALMGVLIHATRLKSMEFSNHASMEWNGEWYKPFAGKEIKQWI